LSRPGSVFVDEGVLDINYVPPQLPHRDEELRFLKGLFRFIIHAPYEMSQRAVIVGGVGSGKTVLAQRFGLDLKKEAAQRRIRADYIHVNCRENRGSLFMVLHQAVRKLRPQFPDRGYSANELLDTLIRILDEEDLQLVLCLDEVDALIGKEGGDALYYLTRVQEERLEGPRRLSLICISKDPEAFQALDRSTLSTLQRNVIRMPEYTHPQLIDILTDRVSRRSGRGPSRRISSTSSASWPRPRTGTPGTPSTSSGGPGSTPTPPTPRRSCQSTCGRRRPPCSPRSGRRSSGS
jgi:cell division control protein 6